MNRNWYAVYTKAQCEKKTALLLTKRKIENFCPLNSRFVKSGSAKKKILNEPLFPSFVFVFISESEMPSVRQTNDVINFVYWLGKPAIIKPSEIENIDLFTSSYFNIEVKKIVVNPAGMAHITNEHGAEYNLRIPSIKVHRVQASLPSLGYTIHAQTEKVISETLKYDLSNSTNA